MPAPTAPPVVVRSTPILDVVDFSGKTKYDDWRDDLPPRGVLEREARHRAVGIDEDRVVVGAADGHVVPSTHRRIVAMADG